MKKILLTIIATSLLFSSDMMQAGVYPECSYVVVTEDGWRLHKNSNGRIISMKAPGTHNTAKGKYSFDEFGNLIAFSQCESSKTAASKENKASTEVEVEIDITKMIEKLQSLKFAVNGGLSMPFGDNLNYKMGYHYGVDIKPKFTGWKKNLSFSFMSMNLGNENADLSSLTSTGLFVNYTCNWKKLNDKKITLVAGLGTMKQEGMITGTSDGMDGEQSGRDFATRVELGYNYSKKINIYAQGIQTSTYLGFEQKATFINLGIKYNF